MGEVNQGSDGAGDHEQQQHVSIWLEREEGGRAQEAGAAASGVERLTVPGAARTGPTGRKPQLDNSSAGPRPGAAQQGEDGLRHGCPPTSSPCG